MMPVSTARSLILQSTGTLDTCLEGSAEYETHKHMLININSSADIKHEFISII